ncbi:MAG: hypothetical protein VYA84_18285 [Planctomycetota bacterium]|nr:hypothetical protein [Planctomycetota bacterium]
MHNLEQSGARVILLLGKHELMLLAMQRMINANLDLSNFPESLFESADVNFLVRDNETWATLKSYELQHAEEPQYWAFRHDDLQQHFERLSKTALGSQWHLPQTHIALLTRCETHHVERNCLFIHAGIRRKHNRSKNVHAAVEVQRQEDAKAICWTRDFLGQEPSVLELVVYGHTPLRYLPL